MRFWSLTGLTPYEEARKLQLALVELRAAERTKDTVLFLEHPPIITRGRGLQQKPGAKSETRHMPVPAVLPAGVAFAETERGGDLTFHGPGQLVIYPIMKIEDVNLHLRKIERLLIEELENVGLAAESRKNATGVWVGKQKVASMGIAVRRWVTYHGMAINIVNDLRPFQFISPCGYSPEVMTRISDLVPELAQPTWRVDWETRLAKGLARMAGIEASRIEIERMTWEEAQKKVAASDDSPSLPGSSKVPGVSPNYP